LFRYLFFFFFFFFFFFNIYIYIYIYICGRVMRGRLFCSNKKILPMQTLISDANQWDTLRLWAGKIRRRHFFLGQRLNRKSMYVIYFWLFCFLQWYADMSSKRISLYSNKTVLLAYPNKRSSITGCGGSVVSRQFLCC
jgi:hypothetical protein